eukprot:scaffold14047_cov127-Isochrysis_galbana.AAC.1
MTPHGSRDPIKDFNHPNRSFRSAIVLAGVPRSSCAGMHKQRTPCSSASAQGLPLPPPLSGPPHPLASPPRPPPSSPSFPFKPAPTSCAACPPPP